MGADRKLLDWDRVVSYFRALEKESNLLRVTELGKTVEGRPLIAAFIASADTLASLDRYRGIQSRLADPRLTSREDAQALWSEGKAVVMITCSIHSTEVASTASAVEIAHRLITRDDSKTKAIRENTIVIVVPSLNPDGVDIVTRWYRQTLGTPYEGSNPPELYHKYLGHDNNRDWYIFSQPETRLVVSKLHNVWHPQIVYDVHQQGAYASRMFVPPWMDPVDPNVDPILMQWSNAIGTGMAADLTSAGKTGVVINAMYDFWTPARHYQSYHGGLRILSESASARLATPITVKREELSGNAIGYSPRQASWNHLEPWQGGEWRVRDIVEYQLIAMESVLQQAATRREELLRSFYRVGERAVNRKSPYAFIIPKVQADPGAARVLLETLAFGAVEIETADQAFSAGGKNYSEGTRVIRMSQPYSSFAKTLLERQRYPDMRAFEGGPPRRPYDVTAHTLPLLMGVAVDVVEQPFKASLVSSTDLDKRDSGTALKRDVLAAGDTESWRAINAAWDEGRPVWRDLSTGNFHLTQPLMDDGPKPLKRPRIGLYKSYMPSMDEGWTRWLLEQFGFRYTSVFNRDLHSPDLRSKFDVIVFPDQRASAIHSGHSAGAMPEAFTGGLGVQGVASLRRFAAAGGTLVFLNGSSDWALEHLGLSVKDVLEGVGDREFYAPGSLLNARLENHPLTLGLPKDITVWFENGPVFDLPSGKESKAVATYPDTGVLASGWLLGEKRIARRVAVADIPLESGHVVLFGIRPQYRAQSYQTFKLFFNSLLYIN